MDVEMSLTHASRLLSTTVVQFVDMTHFSTYIHTLSPSIECSDPSYMWTTVYR